MFLEQQDLDLSRRIVQASWNDPAVIKDDEIRWRDERGEFCKMLMRDRSGASVDNHHPGLLAPLSRPIGYQFRGKMVLIVGEARGHRRKMLKDESSSMKKNRRLGLDFQGFGIFFQSSDLF